MIVLHRANKTLCDVCKIVIVGTAECCHKADSSKVGHGVCLEDITGTIFHGFRDGERTASSGESPRFSGAMHFVETCKKRIVDGGVNATYCTLHGVVSSVVGSVKVGVFWSNKLRLVDLYTQ